jgi:hypothetical protein
MMTYPWLRPACLVLAVGAIVAGFAGMGASFLFLSSSVPNEVSAGAAGFVAGSVFLAAGLVSLTLLATAPAPQAAGAAKEPLRHPESEENAFRTGR